MGWLDRLKMFAMGTFYITAILVVIHVVFGLWFGFNSDYRLLGALWTLGVIAIAGIAFFE